MVIKLVGHRNAEGDECCHCRCSNLNCTTLLSRNIDGGHTHYVHLPCVQTLAQFGTYELYGEERRQEAEELFEKEGKLLDVGPPLPELVLIVRERLTEALKAVGGKLVGNIEIIVKSRFECMWDCETGEVGLAAPTVAAKATVKKMISDANAP